MPNTGLTHFDEGGAAIMVDVSGKEKTHREAVASGRIYVSDDVYAAIAGGTAAKASGLRSAAKRPSNRRFPKGCVPQARMLCHAPAKGHTLRAHTTGVSSSSSHTWRT